MYRVAVTYAIALNLAIGLLAGVGTLSDSRHVPESPPELGWLGIVSWALLLAGTIALLRAPVPAISFTTLSAAASLAGNRVDADSTFLVWALLHVMLVVLIARLEASRRSRFRRAAIHARIDEEIRPVDG